MAKRKTKQTPNQRAYAKQVKRIKQFIRRAEKRGYQFTENVLPQQPKRVTQASIRKLAQLTPEKLYQKAVYGGLASEGEIVAAIEGVKLERSLRAKKAAETRKHRQANSTHAPTNTPGFEPPEKKVMQDSGYMMYHNVFDDFISRISTPTPELTYYGNKRQERNREVSERSRATLYNLTMREVATVGEAELGWRLEKNSNEVQDLIIYVLYGSDAAKIASATSRLASIITGGLTVPELIDLADEEEANEDWELPE